MSQLVTGNFQLIGESKSDDAVAKACDKPFSFKVIRDKEKANKPGVKDEILVIEGIEVPASEQAVDVYINFPEVDDTVPPIYSEYVGTFFCNQARTTQARYSIRSNLEQLKIMHATEVVVTLVSKGSEKNVCIPFKGAKIEIVE